MSWFTTALNVGSTAIGTAATLRGGRGDASALESQAAVAREQAMRDEEAKRRDARQRIGTQAAAFAQSGGGVDEGLLRQSSILDELDALNTRYAGQMRSAALASEARSVRRQSKLLAGAQALSGASSAYTAWKRGL